MLVFPMGLVMEFIVQMIVFAFYLLGIPIIWIVYVLVEVKLSKNPNSDPNPYWFLTGFTFLLFVFKYV